jgi:DNA-binding Xre family transcriptional regulator
MKASKKATKSQAFQTLDDFLASLPKKRRQEIESRSQKKINAIRLQRLREKRHVTQGDLASRLGMKQSSLSRLERRENVTIKTLRDYVLALGGQLRVVAVFEGTKAETILG